MGVEDKFMMICIVELILMSIAVFFDYKYKEIPLWIIATSGVISISEAIFKMTIYEALFAMIPGMIMLIVSWLSKQSMGYGDGLLALSIGLAFGVNKMALGISVAFFVSGLVSLALLVIKKAKRNDTLPFVPFLFIGMVVSMFA